MNRYDADSILFANDTPSFLMYVGILVKRLGYKVYLALDGMEAVRVAQEQRPSIIVLDYQLPEINGTSCLNMMRNDPLLRDTPIVMLGPEDESLTKTAIDKMDIQGYLKKPLNVTDFYLAIQRCLRHSVKRRHIRAPLSLQVSLVRGGEQTELFASNFSVEGLFLRTAEPYPVGTELDLVLTVDDEDPVELKGMVVSVHPFAAARGPEGGMGIRFVDIPEDVSYRLYYFVMKELTKDISVGGSGGVWFDDTLH